MSQLRCPSCGSTDVWCEESNGVHRHGCESCLRIDTFKDNGPLTRRVRERMERDGIPVGTDDPGLLALGARPLEDKA